MHSYWWCAILFRIVLPLTIGTAVFIRPTITSYVYLIAGCYMPFFSVPSAASMVTGTGTYLKILVITCMLNTTLLLSFYFALYFPAEGEYDFEPCSTLETVVRTVGIIEFEGLDMKEAIPWCLPEPLMLLTSLILFIAFKRLCQDTALIEATKQMEGTDIAKENNRKKMLSMGVTFSKYLVVFMCCLTGVLRATVFGGIYYFVFLLVMTYWACNQSLGKVFGRILVFLIPIIFLHITTVFWYQFQYFQDSKDITPESRWGRLFNLVALKTYKDCKDPRIFTFHDQEWHTYSIPICLYVFYILTVLVSRELLHAEDGFKNLIVACFFKPKQLPYRRQWRRALLLIQEQKELDSLAEKSDSLMADKIKFIVDQTLQFIMSISYLAANFIMMIWAIVYVGWKSLILMFWANLIWLLPFKKRVILLSSPLIVVWVWFLLVTTYLYSMDLTSEELPHGFGIVNLKSGVDQTSKYKFLHLLTKSLFGVIIFVTMRQLWQERALKKQQKVLADAVGIRHDETEDELKEHNKFNFLEWFKVACLHFFATWWIWVVILTMIWMDFWTTSNIFRIAFVALAMVFIMTFQLCPFKPWKKFLKIYWWIVIVYAMLNLFAVYLYQISVTRNIMHKLISEADFKLYGFENWSDPKKVTAALANPLFFQIAVVIQQNYLHKEFDRITSPMSPEQMQEEQEKLAKIGPKWRKCKILFQSFEDVVFKILEVHLQNITLLVGWYMCLFDMCALHIPCVLLFTASCVFGRTFTKIIILLISCMVQVLVVLRLLYMNWYIFHKTWDYVGHYTRNGQTFNKTLNTADWIGLHEPKYGYLWADFDQLDWCFLYIFVVTIARVVAIRMDNYRVSRGLLTPKRRVFFPEITWENCHQSTASMLKFLVNYGFYKLGCEITLFFATIVMSTRMDAIAICISLWLLGMFALDRSWMRIFWLPTLILTSVAVPAQYVATLGWWPTYWKYSLTSYWNSSDFLVRIQQFCHLPNMAHPPVKEKISLDYWMLLLLSRQWRAFRKERLSRGQNFPPGSNDNVSELVDDVEVNNPVPDFVSYSRNYLDIFKRIHFTMWFYAALSATFMAGTLRPTLYSFGYIVGAFIFAWEGTDLYLRPPKDIFMRWNCLIAYTILVMVTRTVSQIFGCIFAYQSFFPFNCYVYQLFSIGCVDKFNITENIPNLNKESVCPADHESLGLGFDSLCFFFLIFQQRIFKSFHFFHLVNDAKAQTILSHRGAGLIESIRRKKRESLNVEESQIRDNIKKKMDTLRATHQRVQGDVYQRRKKNHRFMLKSSDYYVFDDASIANDAPLLPPKKEELEFYDFDPYDPPPLGDFFGLLHSSNVQTLLAERVLRRNQKRAIKEGRDPEELRRALYVRPGGSNQPPMRADLPFAGGFLSKWYKFYYIMVFLWAIFESIVVSVTGLINKYSRSFRSILKDMNKEKLTLKEKTNYSQGTRLGSNQIWRPSESYSAILDAVEKGRDTDRTSDVIQFSIYVKLLRSIFYLHLAHSEWICYVLIVINQVVRANFISLPLVILTFCWGSLTVPKPTRTFWVIIIAYVLIMLFIKNFFVMNVSPWHTHNYDWNLFFPPDVIGITHHTNITFNFLMLIAFFFHRVVLQKLGLWKTYTYRRVSLIPDGYYLCKEGQFVALNSENTRRRTPPDTLEVKSVDVAMSDYFPKSVVKGMNKYAEHFRQFIQQLISPSSTQIPVDVYTPMFLCDLINICLILFCYGSFHAEIEDEGLIYFIQNNTVPVSFIITVLVYFALMIIDRAIYLTKNRFAKLVFHYLQMVACHLYFFILYPFLSNKKFINTPVVQYFYVFKCLYFLFSAYQIRNGYPPLISFHHLWHGVTIFNRFGYKFYRLIPYFFEMRTLLDWICSDSSLGVNDWFKMEEITQNIFDQRCEQEFDEKWSSPAGQPKSRVKKYLMGGSLYVLLILTVIFPFLLFSLGGTVGITTHPAKFKIELYMGSAEPIFESYASQKSLKVMSLEDYKNLTSTFNNIEASEKIFGGFQPSDVVVVTWSPHSLTKWKVSPGTYKELMQDVMSNESFSLRVEVHYTHVGHGGQKSQRTFGQAARIPPLPNIHRQNLINVLKSNKTLNTFTWLPLVFPKFLLITKEAEPRPLTIMGEHKHPEIYEPYREQEEHTGDDDDEDIPADPRIHRNLLASLQFDAEGEMWWHISEECAEDDDNYFYYLKDLVHNRCDFLVMYTFNERVFSSAMSYLTQSGILGLYLLYFMMVIGIIRSCRIEIGEIWIEDLPNSELMMRKCLEVYVARDMQNYELEEELFAELIFIMRSRELLIKLTRYTDSNYNPPLPVKKQKRK